MPSPRPIIRNPPLKSINKSNICTNNSFILTNISFIYTFLRGGGKFAPKRRQIFSEETAFFLSPLPATQRARLAPDAPSIGRRTLTAARKAGIASEKKRHSVD